MNTRQRWLLASFGWIILAGGMVFSVASAWAAVHGASDVSHALAGLAGLVLVGLAVLGIARSRFATAAAVASAVLWMLLGSWMVLARHWDGILPLAGGTAIALVIALRTIVTATR